MEDFQPGKWLTQEQELLQFKINRQRFIDLTAYQGIALWWFIRFRLFTRGRTASLVRSLTRNTFLFSLADFVYDFATFTVCKMISWPFKGKADRKRKTVLVTVHDQDWKNMTYLGERQRKGDVFFQSIICNLQKKGFRVVTVTPLKADLVSGVKTMTSRMKHQQPRLFHREFNSYWSMKIWKKEHDARNAFRNSWKAASQNEELMLSLETAGLEDDMPYYFNNIFGYVAKSLEMAEKLVQEEKPDFILVSSEHGIVQKSIMVAGKLRNIPTMALQHGTIGHLHKGYLSSKGSISSSGEVRTPFCPIPDKTAVFGPYYVDLLTKASAYPLDSVVATGQPRYDALVEASRVYSRDKFCRRLGLDPNKRLVLVVTENMPIPDGIAFLKNVLEALKNFPELQIVVKPHPAEVGEWYADVVRQEIVRAAILPKKADTYEAIYACDLFIASYSTVVLEAAILRRLGVTAYLRGGTDPTPYFKEVTLRVYKKEDLTSMIRKALYDEKVREALKQAGAKFVFQHAYKMDGKATERVTSLIETMMGTGA